jgi:hypothetical protein
VPDIFTCKSHVEIVLSGRDAIMADKSSIHF